MEVQPAARWVGDEFLVTFDHQAPVSSQLATRETRTHSTPRFPWKLGITTTVFWVGEAATRGNPASNSRSSWDAHWMRHFGGVDHPLERAQFAPDGFVPSQNPFYVALPFNDIGKNGKTKPLAAGVVPWFHETFRRSGISVLKGRWVAIRSRGKICFAQWEDVGPFYTDHWQYVFGEERPRPNRNRDAGLDVSPAVRDYLGLADMDVADWRFVEVSEVGPGPWRQWGYNNIFAVEKMLSKHLTQERK